MNLSDVYLLARAMNYSDFKAEVARVIDGIPPTVSHSNDYVIVNKTNK